MQINISNKERMNKMKKHRLLFILVILILFVTFTALAIDTFDLLYWYSNASTIHFWNDSDNTLKVYVNKYESGLTKSTIQSYVTMHLVVGILQQI